MYSVCARQVDAYEIGADTDVDQILNGPVTIDEIRQIINGLKNNKAPGIDGIPNETLKNHDIIVLLHKLIQKCFEYGIIPGMWLKALIVPIPKSNMTDPYNPLCYRGISLLSTIAKVYSSFLNKRIMKFCDSNNVIHDEQNGFRKKRSCTDHLFILSAIVRNRINETKDTFAAFIDFQKAFDRVDRTLLFHRLLKYNITGKIYQAVKSIYDSTTSCLLLNGLCTDWFDVLIGSRQGDNLSPTLFILFINDLVTMMKNADVGLQIGEIKINILLYADDIVLLADSANDLNCMLKTVTEWCYNWRLTVNVNKSKIVHFRKSSVRRCASKFRLNDQELELVSTYKYLGFTLSELGHFMPGVNMLSEAAGRALGGLIAKVKCLNDVGYVTFTKMYQAGVTPIMDYGSEIWGFQNYKKPNSIQNRAIRYYLGVHRFAPNPSIQGDIGWVPPQYRCHYNMIRYWNRLINMNDDRLTKVVFNWDYRLQNNNWSTDIKAILNMTNLSETFDTQSPANLETVKERLSLSLFYEWQHEVLMKPKLELYAQHKENIDVEYYVKCHMKKAERSLLAQLRSGTLGLKMETGRFVGISINERICDMCSLEIENEIHFVCKCPLYLVDRDTLFNSAKNVMPSFQNLSDQDKLIFLMKNCQKELAQYTVKAWNTRKQQLFH